MYLKFIIFISYLLGCFVESSAMESMERVLREYGDFSSTSDSHYSSSLPSSPPSLGNTEIPYHFCESGVLIASFNVGQGAFFLIKNANENRVIVVDCGSVNKKWGDFWDAVGKNVRSFLGDSTISACIITHPHTDHYNYLSNFLEEVKDRLERNISIIVGGGQMPKAKSFIDRIKTSLTKEYVSMDVFSVDTNRQKCLCSKNGIDSSFNEIENVLKKALGVSNDNGFMFLRPKLGITNKSANAQSLVFCLNYLKNVVLFTGDATGATLAAMKNSHSLLKNVNFLILPHHGSHTSQAPQWQEKVIEQAESNFVGALIPIDASNQKYGLPTKDVTDVEYPLSAKSVSKRVIQRHSGKDSRTKFIRSHRILYETGSTLYDVFLLKLDNSLSVFDDEQFSRSILQDGESDVFFNCFKPIAFQGESVFNICANTFEKIDSIKVSDFDECLYMAYECISKFPTEDYRYLFKTMLLHYPDLCLPFLELARIMSTDSDLEKYENYYKTILIKKYSLEVKGSLENNLNRILGIKEIDQQLLNRAQERLQESFSKKEKQEKGPSSKRKLKQHKTQRKRRKRT